ncbi:Txe/YoeB family addiction module toxin [Treponema pedis]|uniref:Txe/YoeB family addiction module toxin n=1 Tax=Treponema pedis TaxID=409322 RepID=UPI003CC7DADE
MNKLIEDISRNGNKGLGHPEPLKGNLTGLWSREIDKKNRLIYVIEDDSLTIIQCKNHYKDK